MQTGVAGAPEGIGTQTPPKQQVMLLCICVRYIFLINAPQKRPWSLRLICFICKRETTADGVKCQGTEMMEGSYLRCKKLSNYYQDSLYYSQYASFVLVSGISEKSWSSKSLSHPGAHEMPDTT